MKLPVMSLFTLDELAGAEKIVRAAMPPTPAHVWPLLAAATGVEVIVKHENHTPTGSFKARGGLVYVETLLRSVTSRRYSRLSTNLVAALRSTMPWPI